MEDRYTFGEAAVGLGVAAVAVPLILAAVVVPGSLIYGVVGLYLYTHLAQAVFTALPTVTLWKMVGLMAVVRFFFHPLPEKSEDQSVKSHLFGYFVLGPACVAGWAVFVVWMIAQGY